MYVVLEQALFELNISPPNLSRTQQLLHSHFHKHVLTVQLWQVWSSQVQSSVECEIFEIYATLWKAVDKHENISSSHCWCAASSTSIMQCVMNSRHSRSWIFWVVSSSMTAMNNYVFWVDWSNHYYNDKSTINSAFFLS